MIEMAQVLLDHGANPNAKNGHGGTPLHVASGGKSQERGVSIARLLLERGADVDARKKDKTTPLHSAILWGRLEIAQVLLDHGANATAENDGGE
jgi:cytohesin